MLLISAATWANDPVLLVKTKKHTSFGLLSQNQLQKTLSEYGATPIHTITLPTTVSRTLSSGTATEPDQIMVLTIPSADAMSAHQAIKRLPDVAWAEFLQPVSLFSDLGSPNDPRYVEQDYFTNTMLPLLLRMPIKRSIKVALIDSGIDYTHEDLFGNIWQNRLEKPNHLDDDGNGLVDDLIGYNFYGAYKGEGGPNPKDNFGHGTHLAGIIGAGVNNQTGISGLHPTISLMPLRFTSDTGEGNQLDAALAIRYAIQQQADIIVCAWGYYIPNTVLKDAIADALAQGIVVIAAVGNSGSARLEFPSALPGVIAVGAVSSTGQFAGFSSYGDHVQFVSFGIDIVSTLPNNSYGKRSGTSQSAALMAGTVARILAAQPRLTKDELYTHLIMAADPIVYPQKNPYTGYGILNPETLFKTLNVIPEITIPGSGWKADVVTPPPSHGEDWWVSILLFPWRFLEGIWHWLI